MGSHQRQGRARAVVAVALDLVCLLDQILGGGSGSIGSDGPTLDSAFECRPLSPPAWFSRTILIKSETFAKFDLIDQVGFKLSLA